MVRNLKLVLLLCLSLSLSSIHCMEQRRDPETGAVRVLNMGADAVPGTASPLTILHTDPLISAQTVPLYESIFESETTERFMRIYMPRTEERMRTNFDLIMISDATVDNFPAKYFPWMVDSVVEEGLGFLTTGGSAMYGGYESWSQRSWEGTLITQIFAVDFKANDNYDSSPGGPKPAFYISPALPDDPFVSSLPWDSCPAINYKIHITRTKQGAKTLLEMDIPEKHPVLSTWDIGKGRGTNLIFDWYPWRLEPFQKWEYYIDFASNLVYYSAGLSVPQDLELVHRVRYRLGNYFERRTILLSLLAFVEKFGANIGTVEKDLEAIDADFRRSQELYKEQEWDQALNLLTEMESKMDELDHKAIELKDRALFWIYVIEWFSVAATVFIAGFVVWSLMVKRRLYQDVEVTRLREA